MRALRAEAVRQIAAEYQHGLWESLPEQVRRRIIRRVQDEAPKVVPKDEYDPKNPKASPAWPGPGATSATMQFPWTGYTGTYTATFYTDNNDTAATPAGGGAEGGSGLARRVAQGERLGGADVVGDGDRVERAGEALGDRLHHVAREAAHAADAGEENPESLLGAHRPER